MNTAHPDVNVNLAPSNLANKQLVGVLAIYVSVWAVVYFSTIESMVAIWNRSATYTHCFLILPISLWLIWGRRRELLSAIDGPSYVAFFPLAGFGGVWLAAYLVDVLVVQQFAVLGLLISGIWVILGHAASKTILFPLAYLLFMVPVGEGLVPTMMDFTAYTTVELVRLTGIPVYREGLFFYLPTGTWSVIEACSGIRYLIASVALGCLYAYVNYQHLGKRVVFICAAIVVPVLANSIRAFALVMFGHFSNMKLGTGTDHLVFGWALFGLMFFLLLLVGNIWRDPISQANESSLAQISAPAQPSAGLSRLLRHAALALIVLVLWSLFAAALAQRAPTASKPVDELPELIGWQRVIPANSAWKPLDGGADWANELYFKRDNAEIQIVIHQYYQQKQGKEVVPGQQLLIPEGRAWRAFRQGGRSIELNGGLLTVNESIVKHPIEERLVWQWYWVGNEFTGTPQKVKLLEAWQKISLGRQDAARLYLSIPLSHESDALSVGRDKLTEFLEVGLPTLGKVLRSAVKEEQ